MVSLKMLELVNQPKNFLKARHQQSVGQSMNKSLNNINQWQVCVFHSNHDTFLYEPVVSPCTVYIFTIVWWQTNYLSLHPTYVDL